MNEKVQDTLNQTKAMFGEWKKLADEHWKRWESLAEEVGKYQKQGVEQLGSVIDEVAKAVKGSLEHANKLSDELRKAGLEASKKAREAIASATGSKTPSDPAAGQ